MLAVIDKIIEIQSSEFSQNNDSNLFSLVRKKNVSRIIWSLQFATPQRSQNNFTVYLVRSVDRIVEYSFSDSVRNESSSTIAIVTVKIKKSRYTGAVNSLK